MNINKILLVLKREYLTRVRTKTFILSTLLTPLGMAALIGLVVWLTVSETEVQKIIGVSDQTGVLYAELENLNPDRYKNFSDIPVDSLRSKVLAGEIDGFLLLEEKNITEGAPAQFIYGGSGGLEFQAQLRSDVRESVREVQLSRAQVSDEIREIFNSRIGLESKKLSKEGEEEDDNSMFASIFGFVLGLLIFIGLFGFGAILMRSVIEEKTSRIVEVIASSIKPIELMMGKLLGVCMLAITQFGFWIVMYTGLSVAAAPFAGFLVDAQTKNLPQGAVAENAFDPSTLEGLVVDPMIFVWFFLFFILGFLLYSSLFAAVGAAVDSEQDTQQFMLPLMMPIMLGYFLNTKVMTDPDSNLAVFASLFPLTSPINMITRATTTQVPVWQMAVSILLLVVSFIGVMWLSAKIYRVGILMYGKKASFGELAKWIRQ